MFLLFVSLAVDGGKYLPSHADCFNFVKVPGTHKIEDSVGRCFGVKKENTHFLQFSELETCIVHSVAQFLF